MDGFFEESRSLIDRGVPVDGPRPTLPAWQGKSIWLRTSIPRPWDTEALERRYKAATDGIERSHLQIVWLLSQGHSARAVASVTGYSPTWISTIVWRYNDHGVEGLGDRRHDNPGAVALVDEAQQERLRATLAEPPPDQGLGTGRKVAQGMSGQLGRLVSPQRGVE